LQVSGAVSFDQGWTFDYQRDLATDPAALPIDRSTMNYLFNAITTVLKQYEENSIPEFITAANNGGSAFAYGFGSQVLWSASGNAPFIPYTSILAGNTNVPTDSSNTWVPINVGSTSGQFLLGASATLTQQSIGAETLFASTGLTATLPLSTGFPTGAIIRVNGNSQVGGGTVAKTGADVILNGTLGSVTSMVIGGNDQCDYFCLNGTGWMVIGGSAALSGSSTFLNTVGTSGYQSFPGGFKLQRGSVGTIAQGSTATATFPVAFTTCFGVVASLAAQSVTSSIPFGVGVGNYTATSCPFYNNGANGPISVNYFAIGK